jgi:hypothetical protein
MKIMIDGQVRISLLGCRRTPTALIDVLESGVIFFLGIAGKAEKPSFELLRAQLDEVVES